MTSISQIKMLSWTIQKIPTFLACLNNLAFTRNENTCIEILLANQTYSIMISTTKTPLHLQINIQHYDNKNYKIHTGTYTIQ